MHLNMMTIIFCIQVFSLRDAFKRTTEQLQILYLNRFIALKAMLLVYKQIEPVNNPIDS